MVKKKKNIIVEIPRGRCCSYCCGDCIYMNMNYINDYGEAWCEQYKKYYSTASNANSCDYYVERR